MTDVSFYTACSSYCVRYVSFGPNVPTLKSTHNGFRSIPVVVGHNSTLRKTDTTFSVFKRPISAENGSIVVRGKFAVRLPAGNPPPGPPIDTRRGVLKNPSGSDRLARVSRTVPDIRSPHAQTAPVERVFSPLPCPFSRVSTPTHDGTIIIAASPVVRDDKRTRRTVDVPTQSVA